MAKVQRRNRDTIWSHTKRAGRMQLESRQMCAEFRWYFVQVFGARSESNIRTDLTSYLGDMLRLSAQDVEFREMLITAEDIWDLTINHTTPEVGWSAPSSVIFVRHTWPVISWLMFTTTNSRTEEFLVLSHANVVLLKKDPNKRIPNWWF